VQHTDYSLGVTTSATWNSWHNASNAIKCIWHFRDCLGH